MCDPLSCVRSLWGAAPPAVATEANAERLCGAFEAQVFAIEKEISTHTARARALVGAAKALKEQKNPAFAKKEAEAKAAVARMTALRKKRDRLEGFAAHFRKIKENIGDARQFQETVGALAIASQEMKRLKLPKLAEKADSVSAFTEDINAHLEEISTALAGPTDGPSTQEDMEALEAYLALEQECEALDDTPNGHVQNGVHDRKLTNAQNAPRMPTRGEYAAALFAGAPPAPSPRPVGTALPL